MVALRTPELASQGSLEGGAPRTEFVMSGHKNLPKAFGGVSGATSRQPNGSCVQVEQVPQAG